MKFLTELVTVIQKGAIIGFAIAATMIAVGNIEEQLYYRSLDGAEVSMVALDEAIATAGPGETVVVNKDGTIAVKK